MSSSSSSHDLYQLAERFVGEVQEVSGPKANPFILWCHQSCGIQESSDEIPWCSSFLNRLAWLLRLPRSKSARARSWLTVGTPVELAEVQRGDIVVLKRGADIQPGPEVLNAPGHVTLYAGRDSSTSESEFLGLGGNQTNGVTIARFWTSSILGIRRLVR